MQGIAPAPHEASWCRFSAIPNQKSLKLDSNVALQRQRVSAIESHRATKRTSESFATAVYGVPEDSSISFKSSEISGSFNWDKMSAPKSVVTEVQSTLKPGSFGSGHYFTPASKPVHNDTRPIVIDKTMKHIVHDNISTSFAQLKDVRQDQTIRGGRFFRKHRVPIDSIPQ